MTQKGLSHVGNAERNKIVILNVILDEVPASGGLKVRGPKAGNLRLRRNYGYALGLNIEPEQIEVCAVGLSGEVRKFEVHRLRDRGSEPTIRQLAEVAVACRRELAAVHSGKLLGVGIAIAGEGDKLASLLVFDAAELIGIGLADLVSVIDPGTIILAGEVVRGLGPLLVEGIVRTVRLRGIHPITQRTQFLTGSDIPHMGARGAATLPLEHWFASGILNI